MRYQGFFSVNGGQCYNNEPYESNNKNKLIKLVRSIAVANTPYGDKSRYTVYKDYTTNAEVVASGTYVALGSGKYYRNEDYLY
jgi:hypothetical protein